MMKKPPILFAALMIAVAGAAFGAEEMSLDEAVQGQGQVIFIRHAYAPGFGDPPHFEVGDCATQRNLDDTGRQQSRRIGAALRDAGLANTRVLSSPWCRCIDTARLLAIGEVEVVGWLGSFFQGHVDEGETLARLNDYLAQVPRDMPPPVLVTHYVVIGAVTGLAVPSGGAVLYDPATQRAWAIAIGQTE